MAHEPARVQWPRVWRIALVVALAGSVRVPAQAADSSGGRTASDVPADCRDTLIAANVSRLTIYQQAVVHDTTRAILAQVDLLAWRIAQGVRASLGAHGVAVPAGDSLGKWPRTIRRLPFDIVVRRNGPGAWRMGTVPDSDAASPALIALYEQTLRAIPPDSIWIIFPDGYTPDSVVFRLDLVAFAQSGRLFAGKSSIMALFSSTGVAERPAMEKHHLTTQDPEDAIANRIFANLLLQFVVDTTGRADKRTIRVLRPTEAQLDSSEYAHYLREFIDVTRKAIERDRFIPAHVGRCAVRETVQLPVSYAFH